MLFYEFTFDVLNLGGEEPDSSAVHRTETELGEAFIKFINPSPHPGTSQPQVLPVRQLKQLRRSNHLVRCILSN